MERDLRRSGDRDGHPGPDSASCGDGQHHGELLSAKREGQGGARPQAWAAAFGSDHAGGIAEESRDGFRTRRSI